MVKRDNQLMVLLPVYRESRDLIKETVDSILNSSYDLFDLYIVDDGVEARIRDDEFDDKRITVITNERNMGLTKSLIAAIEKYNHYKYIARIDAGDLVAKERFQKQVSILENNSSIAVVSSYASVINKMGKEIGMVRTYTDPQDIRLILPYHNQIVGPAATFRRSAYDDVGGYDPFFIYSQDYELWLRMAKKYDIANLHDVLHYLRFDEQSLTFSKRTEQERYCQIARILHYPKLRLSRDLDQILIRYKIAGKRKADIFFYALTCLFKKRKLSFLPFIILPLMPFGLLEKIRILYYKLFKQPIEHE